MFINMFLFMFQMTLFSRRSRRKKRKRIRSEEDSAEDEEETVQHHRHSVLVHRQSNSLVSTITRKTSMLTAYTCKGFMKKNKFVTFLQIPIASAEIKFWLNLPFTFHIQAWHFKRSRLKT